LKLIGTQELLVCFDNVTIMGESMEALLVASKENGLDINTEKSKYNTNNELDVSMNGVYKVELILSLIFSLIL
jgi:hypothetical protein